MYTQSITRSRRTAFFLAIDCSGSMAEPIRFRGRPTTKAEAVASVANGLLFELIERARRSDGVRNYYDIAVLGYSGDDEVSSLLPGDRDTLSVTELAAVRPDIRRETVECRLPDGGIALRELPVPVWIEPRAAGQTPMCEALRRIRDLAAAWCADPSHAESFPPIVFNITDGEATDCDEEEPRYPNRYAALLYDCSSVMPAVFDEAIRAAKGPGAVPPFRGVSYNASADELVAMLNIGSISVKTE